MNWDEYFLCLARTAAAKSRCLSRQIGAVVLIKLRCLDATTPLSGAPKARKWDWDAKAATPNCAFLAQNATYFVPGVVWAVGNRVEPQTRNSFFSKTLSGRVTNLQGSPLSGYEMFLVHRQTGRLIARTTTAADGTYAFYNLAGGTSLFRVDCCAPGAVYDAKAHDALTAI